VPEFTLSISASFSARRLGGATNVGIDLEETITLSM
jgi:hypothetical protein